MGKYLVVFGLILFAGSAAMGQAPGDATTSPAVKPPPTAGGSGQDVCAQMHLEGTKLSDCRHDWTNARTNADRLAVRNRYAGQGTAEASHGKTAEHPEASGPCDTLGLAAPDLTQCRAQWESAEGARARKAVVDHYREIAAGKAAGSRIDPDSKK